MEEMVPVLRFSVSNGDMPLGLATDRNRKP